MAKGRPPYFGPGTGRFSRKKCTKKEKEGHLAAGIEKAKRRRENALTFPNENGMTMLYKNDRQETLFLGKEDTL